MNKYVIEVLSVDEAENINGGFITTIIAIGGVAGALLAVYECGKATGEFIAEITKE